GSDLAKLADDAIRRADQSGISQGTHAGSQATQKKIIEGRIDANIRLRGFRHVHPITPDKPCDGMRGEATAGPLRQPAGNTRQCLPGKQVLQLCHTDGAVWWRCHGWGYQMPGRGFFANMVLPQRLSWRFVCAASLSDCGDFSVKLNQHRERGSNQFMTPPLLPAYMIARWLLLIITV